MPKLPVRKFWIAMAIRSRLGNLVSNVLPFNLGCFDSIYPNSDGI